MWNSSLVETSNWIAATKLQENMSVKQTEKCIFDTDRYFEYLCEEFHNMYKKIGHCIGLHSIRIAINSSEYEIVN